MPVYNTVTAPGISKADVVGGTEEAAGAAFQALPVEHEYSPAVGLKNISRAHAQAARL